MRNRPRVVFRRRCRLLCMGLWLTLCLLFSACAGDESSTDPLSRSEFALDTLCTVTLYEPADPALLDAAFTLIAAEEALLSRTKEGSDVGRVNHAAGAPTQVGEDTAELIALGLEYSALSGGIFDITVGRLSELWDFSGGGRLPEAAELAEAVASVDYRKLSVAGQTVTLADPDSRLELGAIAKGYIADRVAELLKQEGAVSAVIDLGGNVVTVGSKPDGSAWNIGVQQPFGRERSELIGLIQVAGDASLVTSGIYERNFEREGVLYHHILDPRTGYPAETDVIGVTVVSKSSARGDALSTVCLLLGREEGSRLLEAEDDVLGALWVDSAGEVHVQGDIDFAPAP